MTLVTHIKDPYRNGYMRRRQPFALFCLKTSCEQGAVVFPTPATFSGVTLTPKTGPSLQAFNAGVTGMERIPFKGDFKAR